MSNATQERAENTLLAVQMKLGKIKRIAEYNRKRALTPSSQHWLYLPNIGEAIRWTHVLSAVTDAEATVRAAYRGKHNA